MLQVSSNMTLEEKIKYGKIDQSDFNNIIDELLDKMHRLEKEVEYQNGLEERLREQIWFAQNVIEEIQHSVKQARSVGQARKGVERAIDEGLFEM